ncbi:TrmB family transcriptional regulator [Methanobrevibacter sp.]
MENSIDKDIIESLKVLGLSSYEALAYYSLNSMIEAKATEISEKSNIPRTKIYSVLKSLTKKGYIETDFGHPNIYSAVNPSIIFKNEKEKLIEKLNNSENELIYNYENQISKVPAPMWLIREENKIINKEIEIIKKCQSELKMRIGFLFENELKPLKNALIKASKNNVKINILASPYCIINDKEVNIKEELKHPNIKIKNADIPVVKMMIRDGKEMLHIYSKFSKEKRIPLKNTSIAMWNQYEDISKNYDERFNKAFKGKNKKN